MRRYLCRIIGNFINLWWIYAAQKFSAINFSNIRKYWHLNHIICRRETRKGVERIRKGRMTPNERRQVLLALLCHRRYDTCKKLAEELGVSRATISHDITILMCSYPIETVRGNGGGVKVADKFYLHHKTLNEKQIALLMRIQTGSDGDDLDTINSILYRFTL